MCLHGVKVTPSVMTEAAPELVYTGFPSLHDCCGGDDICNNAAVMTKGLAFLHVHDGLSAALDVTDNGAFDSLPVRFSVQLGIHICVCDFVCKVSSSFECFVSFAYPFPDFTALMDLLYISRLSAVRPTLQTLAPIQSSTPFSQYLFGLPLFIWPSTFPSSINVSILWCLFYVRNNLSFAF